MVFACGLQQIPRTKQVLSKVVFCANRPFPRAVRVEGGAGRVALVVGVVPCTSRGSSCEKSFGEREIKVNTCIRGQNATATPATVL